MSENYSYGRVKGVVFGVKCPCTVIFTVLRELEAAPASVMDLDPVLYFRIPVLLEDWRRFIAIVEERLQVARQWETGSSTKFRACDNLQVYCALTRDWVTNRPLDLRVFGL
ncbi:hypothetical protein GGX14DRAFT_406325 [Mycena pura]|uniref:Uncharacterized protein n=1 Tax=Mycena pura TaxID=153505 RepID=A0AAD6Y5M4_9AGAR|nr:hypothetical protein GGX14DRAFT_406325 [Mycena pura]